MSRIGASYEISLADWLAGTFWVDIPFTERLKMLGKLGVGRSLMSERFHPWDRTN